MIPVLPNSKERKKDLLGDEVIQQKLCFTLSPLKSSSCLALTSLSHSTAPLCQRAGGKPWGWAVFTAVLNSNLRAVHPTPHTLRRLHWGGRGCKSFPPPCVPSSFVSEPRQGPLNFWLLSSEPKLPRKVTLRHNSKAYPLGQARLLSAGVPCFTQSEHWQNPRLIGPHTAQSHHLSSGEGIRFSHKFSELEGLQGLQFWQSWFYEDV